MAEAQEVLAGVTVVRTPAALRAVIAQWRQAGDRVGLVPTMGALHQGHVSLVEVARQQAQRVVLTIFVNPLQFGPTEDLDKYPRQLLADCALAAAHGVDAIFAPAADAIYPPGFVTHVTVDDLTVGLCGQTRPGHFRGVTTVVLKLLNLAMADVAVFGQKDWQQLQVIAQMARDLDHPTAVVGAPIVREASGLALSSRNVYLSADERSRAAAIYATLVALRQRVRAGEQDVAVLQRDFAESMAAAGGRIDYAEVVEPQRLTPLTHLAGPAQMIVAVWFGPARLLDNLALC
jgi:pantoate--beta-alanine ligase